MKEMKLLASTIVLLSLVGCSGQYLPQPDPQPGETNFISAYNSSSNYGDGRYGEGPSAGVDDEQGGSNKEERTVEEGDIYRLMGGGLLLNLNSYRGLQVIDISDVENPRIIGKLRVSGTPVEMYVVGNFAYLLLNNWYGYYWVRSSASVEPYYGGLVVAVDISNPSSPRWVEEAQVPGWIRTSRLAREGAKAALYVAASDWSSEATTYVRSFGLMANGTIEMRTTLDLGGYIQDIQATPQALLVARNDWNRNNGRSSVTIIDISNPDGIMVQGAEIITAGQIQNQFNMDLYRGVLRLVSGSTWGGVNENHLETFNVADIQNPVAIDHETFGEGESLYATLFLGNRAFFVTYQRVDPFHAFYIDDQGQAQPKSEFVISGWNDFFRAVADGTRLIGIGVDDENGWTMAVSLYDISNLENPQPFLARQVVEADSSWSEARWDHRAFSVVENAVSVRAADGAEETGLVLLPFSGYDHVNYRYQAGVQIFTFSDHTLTRRGLMLQDNWVRRSFLAGDSLTANLSDADLTLFGISSPDRPQLLGRLDLAPYFADFFIFGQHGVRLRYSRADYWWWGSSAGIPDNFLETVSLAGDPDESQALAVAAVAGDAQVVQVGRLAVSLRYSWIDDGNGGGSYRTHLTAIDFTDPLRPQSGGTLEIDGINPGYWGGYYPGWGMEDGRCFDCGYYYGGQQILAVGDSLVLPSAQWEQELMGREHVCYTYPVYYESCEKEQGECEYYSGGIQCSSLNGAPAVCTGEIYRCIYQDGDYECQVIDPDSIETRTECWDNDRYRYWVHYDLYVVDLRDPAQPRLASVIRRPAAEEDVSLLARGNDLLLTFRHPENVPGDGRPYARYFFKRINLSDPTRPVLGPSINIPGVLIDAEGEMIYTRDFVWGDEVVETALNKLRVHANYAELLARVRFENREVYQLVLDGRGHALVTSRLSWREIERQGLSWDEVQQVLDIFDISGENFSLVSSMPIDTWAELKDARDGRALFAVPGGLLAVNIVDAAHPYAQAFFPTLWWPYKLVVNDGRIYFPAGRFGLFYFDLDSYNLLDK